MRPTNAPLHSPTDEQQAIIDATSGTESLMISAYAGSAKTTTLQMAAPKVRVPALALAFNKKISQELQGRLPGNFTVKTLNGLGHGAWLRRGNITSVTLDDRKIGKLVTQVADGAGVKLNPEQWAGVRELVTGAMQAGLSPGDRGDPLLADTPEAWNGLDAAESIPLDSLERSVLLARDVLSASIKLAEAGVISFDDQVYCPTIIGGAWPKWPVVFVDESQDLSPLNHRMLELCSRPGGKIVAVGDPKQAIYAWRGADSASMSTIRKLSPNWLDLGLHTSFRCPKAVVVRQQHHAPGFVAWTGCAPGRVEALPEREQEGELGGWSWGTLAGLSPQPGSTIAVLCRNNGPLLSLAFKLIREGVGPVMLGRDIGKGLVVLSRKLGPDDAMPVEAFCGKLTDWLEREVGLAIANDKPERVPGLQDRAECLRAVVESAGVRDAGELRRALERLFAREGGQVTLSSIHRSKGLEWDVVLHLDPWRVPSKQSRLAAAAGDRRALEQEWNLRYVAETRTRNVLALGRLEDFT